MHADYTGKQTAVRRQVPRYAALRELLRPAPLQFDGVGRRLNRAASIADLQELARKRIPRAPFDFADGAAGVGELALERAREVFSRIEFHLLSSHGGRQLDRAAVPIEVVPAVREALDDRVELFVDTGIMSGADIVAAVAMGANATLVGRAYLYGLMAGGRRGVAKAVNILTDEVSRTMPLLGVTRIDQLRPEHVSIRPN
jgi:hypothetical protein